MGLLEKFDKVKPKTTGRLSPEDIGFCDTLTENANVVLGQLKECWVRNNELFKNENLGYTINDGRYVSKPTNLWNGDNDFIRFQFSYAESVLAVESECNGLIETYKDRIIRYFEQRYNLSLGNYSGYGSRNLDGWREELKDADRFNPVGYEDVIDWIVEKTDGANFRELGETRFKDDFQKRFEHWGSILFEIKNATMKIDDFHKIYPSGLYNDKYEYKAESRFLDIEKALNFFEAGELTKKIDSTLSGLVGYRCDFLEITFSNYSKTKSIKFFKNGRVDIKFNSPTYANEFYNFYKLYELEKKD